MCAVVNCDLVEQAERIVSSSCLCPESRLIDP
jgi:hypothetical protein